MVESISPVLVLACIWFHTVMLTSFSPSTVRKVANRAYVGNGFVTDSHGFAVYVITLVVVAVLLAAFQPVLVNILTNFFELYDFIPVNLMLLATEFVFFERFVLGRPWFDFG
jgi:hypothetical protein